MDSLSCKSSVILIPVLDQSKSRVCDHSHTGIRGWNPAGGNGRPSLVNAVRCQIQLSATVRSIVQGSPTECVCVISMIKCNNNPLHQQ
jgi:hypothetical protein